jgi:hypothetical protein
MSSRIFESRSGFIGYLYYAIMYRVFVCFAFSLWSQDIGMQRTADYISNACYTGVMRNIAADTPVE